MMNAPQPRLSLPGRWARGGGAGRCRPLARAAGRGTGPVGAGAVLGAGAGQGTGPAAFGGRAWSLSAGREGGSGPASVPQGGLIYL